MLKYYIKIVYRNFINQRPYSFLNLAGLIVGLCISFIALLYVLEETGWDLSHKKHENVYRLLRDVSSDKEMYYAPIDARIPIVLKEEIPEILAYASYEDIAIEVNDNLEEKGCFFSDPEIVDILTFDVLSGNLNTFKNDFQTIIISEKFALKYFNAISVVGKSLILTVDGEKKNFTIASVYKNFEKKSSFRPDLILSNLNSTSYKKDISTSETYKYTKKSMQTFFLLSANTSPISLGEKIKATQRSKIPFVGQTDYKLQPLVQIHLQSQNVVGGLTIKGSIERILIFASFGILILIISIINYLLLYSAISVRRFKEFAIRKVSGLSFKDLLKLFWIESLVIGAVASIIAVVIIQVLIPLFNDYTKSAIKLDFSMSYGFTGYAILITVFVSLIAGGYFSFNIYKSSAIELLHKNTAGNDKSFKFKGSTVIIQFFLVSFMLLISMGYFKQLDFMMNSYKGYDASNTIILSDNSKWNPTVFQQEAVQYPIISETARGPYLPNTRKQVHIGVNLKGVDKSPEWIQIFPIGFNYIPFYKMNVKMGRNFSRDFATDKKDAVIFNEAAIKFLNIENPIGKETNMGTIIGVVEDFKFKSFHKSTPPIFFKIIEDLKGELIIRHKVGKRNEAVEVIESIIKKKKIDSDLDSLYLDKLNSTMYEHEFKIRNTILIFTISAIFITILGLIGMSLFKAESYTKEIGIRKVNGASISEIIYMLNKGLVKWITIALLISFPTAYYLLNKLLESFAYKTSLSWWVFALAGVFTLVIALLTVSWQSYRAATRNPVEALRDE